MAEKNGKHLVIVESPAKAKTIEKYLGRDYAVRASYGHIRDLPKSDLGVDVDPANPDHVWAGLEEVFETKDAGSHWAAIAPYWNFGFPCWDISDAKKRA